GSLMYGRRLVTCQLIRMEIWSNTARTKPLFHLKIISSRSFGKNMSKIKIPLWDNAWDFPEKLENVGLMLLAMSDRDFQVRVWAKAEGPEVEWFDEAYFDVELQTEFFKEA